MLKKTLVVLGLMLGAVSANAATEVFDVQLDTCTWVDVSVSSTVSNPAATQLLSATLIDPVTSFLKLMPDRKFIEIQNVSMTTFTYVFVEVGLSSTSANGDLSLTQPTHMSKTVSEMIAPQGGKLRLALPGKNKDGRIFVPWAVNNGGVGTSPVVIKQCK